MSFVLKNLSNYGRRHSKLFIPTVMFRGTPCRKTTFKQKIHHEVENQLIKINLCTPYSAQLCTHRTVPNCVHRTVHNCVHTVQYTIAFVYCHWARKELSFCHKLWFSNFNIVATQCRRPLIFQTMNAIRSKNVSLKY